MSTALAPAKPPAVRTEPKRHLYHQPEVLSTATYSVGALLAEDDGWARVDMQEYGLADMRRSLAAGEIEDALETACDLLGRDIVDLAIILRTGEVPDVFVREKS